MVEKIITCLVELGGNHWEKYGKNRVYFDGSKLAVSLGYEWDNYNTGNISYAKLDGEKISNSEMNRVLNSLNCKLYYDLDDEKFHWYTSPGIRQEHIEMGIEFLKEKIEEIN